MTLPSLSDLLAAEPLLFWLFGPVLLVVSTCALVAALFYLDKSPARAMHVG